MFVFEYILVFAFVDMLVYVVLKVHLNRVQVKF